MAFFRILCIALSVAAAPALAQTVAASRTRLLSWPDPSRAGESVLLQAEVDGLGGGAPTGAVSIADGAVALGAGTLSPLGAGQETLVAKYSHTCAIGSSGGVKCWGQNEYGQLGVGTATDRHIPVGAKGLANGFVAIAAGLGHTCALSSAGAVQCWGKNSFGQLGDGTTSSRQTPAPVSGLSRGVIAITAGIDHSCALTSAGAVLCWGWNGFGQLGDNSIMSRSTPVAVSGLSRGVVALDAGGHFTCALTSTGGVKCWGANTVGELGDRTATARRTPVDVWGLSSGVASIATGYAHACAVVAGGAAWCWGLNDHGQLGDGTITNFHRPMPVSGLSSGVVVIAAGSRHSCALVTDGTVECWGANYAGQLGDGTMTRLRGPSAPREVSGLAGVVAIAAGHSHSCALTGAGAPYCWGENWYGQLGDGTRASRRLTPTPVFGLQSLVRARARLETDALGVGTHRLQASYPGDGAHGASSRLRTHFVVP